MPDLLLDLVIIWLLFLLYRRWVGVSHRPGRPPNRPPTDRRRIRSGGEMVACTHCGLLIPRDEGVTDSAGNVYCSPEHAKAHR